MNHGVQLRAYKPMDHHIHTRDLSPAEQALVAELVADGLSIQNTFRPEPLCQKTGKGHHESRTVEESQRARETTPGKAQP